MEVTLARRVHYAALAAALRQASTDSASPDG
jgi:hypothetical protein